MNQPEPAGRRFRTFFTAVCVDIRANAGASLGLASDRIGVDSNSVRRFELGKNFPHTLLERYAAGYASLANPPMDARHVFLRAANWWLQAGQAPALAATSGIEPTPEEIIAAIRQAEKNDGGTVQAGGQPSATPKRHRDTG